AENVPDVNGTTYPNTDYKILIERDPDLLTYDIVFIVWNTLKSPFDNLLARRAFAYATPYEKIYSEVYDNLTVPLYGVIPKGMPGYTETGIIKYEYNITKAKELIEKSGVLKGSVMIIPLLPFPVLVLPVTVVRKEEEE
ncbi:MAG: ABC transporter substrate-binding protein, partial [Candidatus Njordarchaeota archaeon]